MKASSAQAKEYQKLVNQKSPPRPILRNTVLAFLVGGLICVVGQVILGGLTARAGMGRTEATSLTSGIMVALGSTLTGLGLYDEIGRVGGMGSAIPITGFANSITSPAMEFKTEGFILGLGARMFTIAGPVIVYGLITAVAVSALRIFFLRGL